MRDINEQDDLSVYEIYIVYYRDKHMINGLLRGLYPIKWTLDSTHFKGGCWIPPYVCWTPLILKMDAKMNTIHKI